MFVTRCMDECSVKNELQRLWRIWNGYTWQIGLSGNANRITHDINEALLKYMVLNFFYEDRGFNLVQAGLYIQRSELTL